MVLREQHVALPLVANDELIAVLVLDTVPHLDSRCRDRPARPAHPRHAVQLQAALLFGRVRDTATSEERQRIAREVHDGVAQDVASLGYLVDNLAATTTDPTSRSRSASCARRSPGSSPSCGTRSSTCAHETRAGRRARREPLGLRPPGRAPPHR